MGFTGVVVTTLPFVPRDEEAFRAELARLGIPSVEEDPSCSGLVWQKRENGYWFGGRVLTLDVEVPDDVDPSGAVDLVEVLQEHIKPGTVFACESVAHEGLSSVSAWVCVVTEDKVLQGELEGIAAALLSVAKSAPAGCRSQGERRFGCGRC
ncbi:MAG: hypothetical protein AB1609_21770 [Bacillota bacterium]